MNINNVYECDIYRLEERKLNKFNIKESGGNNIYYYIDGYFVNKCVFVKKALVYFSICRGGLIDIETGEFYNLGYPRIVGTSFVDVNKSKIYGKDIMGTDKKHYSKKKILKRYSEYKGGDYDECE